MPNLAAKNGSGGGSSGGGIGGGHHGVYLHSQSQPSSQYRIKEYPLYVEGSPNPVVVRSLESDQEGHYSVKAQFKTSSSYTAGGLYKEAWGGGGGGRGQRPTHALALSDCTDSVIGARGWWERRRGEDSGV